MGTEANPIEARGLSKTYRIGFLMNKSVRALQGLDLDVPNGSIYGLVGPNGAGKSTTIKILMNLVRQSSGHALLFGKPVDTAEMRRWVGFLPENPAPYEYLTGREFVTLAARLSGGLSGQELDRRVSEVLGEVDLGKAERLQIRRYSKGMVQRVALAQALVGRPRLLILDEPTSGLDPIGRRQIRELLLQEKQRGTTILFCTHIIPDVEATCDRVAILVGGRRVREGTINELVAADQSTVELTLHGLPSGWDAGVVVRQGDARGDGIVLVASETHAQRIVAKAISDGGRVSRVQPARRSLEELFIDAVREGGRTVGGEINA